jgi:hypothetical protein
MFHNFGSSETLRQIFFEFSKKPSAKYSVSIAIDNEIRALEKHLLFL